MTTRTRLTSIASLLLATAAHSIASTPPALEIGPAPGGDADWQLQWQGVTGTRYHVFDSGELRRWDPMVDAQIDGDGTTASREFLAQGPAGFFKVVSEPVVPEQKRFVPVPADGTRYDTYEEFADPIWPENYAEGIVTLWRDDKFAAYSITIDDNNSPDFPFWLEVADDYGWKFTWFVIVHPYVWDIYNDVVGSNTSYFGTLDEFKALADEGHDIQLHGACSAMNDLDEAGYRDHIEKSINVLSQTTSQPVITFAYPCGKTSSNDGTTDYLAILSETMIGARGTAGGTTPVHLLDYLQTKSLGANFLVDGAPDTQFGRVSDKRNFLYSAYRGWCVSLYHGLDESGETSALELFDYLKANEAMFWIAPFTDVAKYAQERETATVNTLEATTDRILITVADKMDDTLFDHPVTVKVRLDASWLALDALQNGETIPATLVAEAGVPYALVDAVPDRGVITINRVEP